MQRLLLIIFPRVLFKMEFDNQIISGIRNGNNNLVKTIYDRYRSEFIGWAYKTYNCNEEDAKEVYQRSFVILYQKIIDREVNHITHSIKSYLFTIGKNLLREESRINNKFSKMPTYDIADASVDDEELQDKEEKFNRIEQGLNEMGEPCKTILLMSFFHKKSSEEISRKFGYKNSDTAKNIKYKCFKRLQKAVHMLGVKAR
jgi:RNA polymerase sigma factor (sigma-70 family)